MFTGIITNLGKIMSKKKDGLIIQAEKDLLKKLEKGLSISINGICLTVVSFDRKHFNVNFIPETEKKTNIRYLKPSDSINLELPATAKTFLSGHILQGHIDDVSKLVSIEKKENSHVLKFFISKTLSKYVVEKGSIAVNGISLTVIQAKDTFFTVGIIPYTWKNTNLAYLKIGDFVNLEVDVLAKYLERLMVK